MSSSDSDSHDVERPESQQFSNGTCCFQEKKKKILVLCVMSVIPRIC